MTGYRISTLRFFTAIAALLAALAVEPRITLAAPDVVAQLLGSWGGSGRIHYTDGTSEGISCNAYYSGGGHELRLAIQCKSEKNPIHIRSSLRVSGGQVSGDWEERTFNASGTASGELGANSLKLNVSGGGFTGTMNVSVGRNSHSVSIETQGIAMRSATMNLTKR